jgi:hypothetical protein
VPTSQTGFISGFAHCPKALATIVDAPSSKEYTGNFMEASGGDGGLLHVDRQSLPINLDAN